jgi:hypothetical protein
MVLGHDVRASGVVPESQQACHSRFADAQLPRDWSQFHPLASESADLLRRDRATRATNRAVYSGSGSSDSGQVFQ